MSNRITKPPEDDRSKVVGRRLEFDLNARFAKLDGYCDEPFMPEGRQQPQMPPPCKLFDE
jgi:hypothetical protein